MSENGLIIDSTKTSCITLQMENVVLSRNRCSGSSCLRLSHNNELKNIHLFRNRGNSEISESAIFSAGKNSTTTAMNVSSVRNRLRTFCVNAGMVNLRRSLFKRNKWNDSSSQTSEPIGGGVVLAIKSTVYIQKSDFKDNYANSGSCILARSSQLNISNCMFRYNSVERDGGAIYASRRSSLDLSESQLWNNNAIDGGVLLIESSSHARISTSTFKSNIASSNGGAIMLSRDAVIVASDCAFEGTLL